MSKTKVLSAKYWGLKGPDFPAALESLQALVDKAVFSSVHIERIARTLPGFLRTWRPQTTDGYTWFTAVEFAAPRGTINIFFSWCQDWQKKDGSACDRHIAVYVKGMADRFIIDLTIWRLRRAFA